MKRMLIAVILFAVAAHAQCGEKKTAPHVSNEIEFTGFTAGGALAGSGTGFQALVTMGTYDLCTHLGVLTEAGTIRQLPGDLAGFGALNMMSGAAVPHTNNDYVFATAGLNFAHTVNFGVGWDHAVHHKTSPDSWKKEGYDTAWRLEVRDYFDYNRKDHNIGFRIAYFPGFSRH